MTLDAHGAEDASPHLLVVGSQHAKPADREAPRSSIEPLQVVVDGRLEPLTAWSRVGELGVAGLAWDAETSAVWVAVDDALLRVASDGVTTAPVDDLLDVHELRAHGRSLMVASTGTDTIVTVDLDTGQELRRDRVHGPPSDALTTAFTRATRRTERFHANQGLEDTSGGRWALVHHVAGLQVVQEVATRWLKRQGDGGLVSLDDDQQVDLGLAAPHSVRRVGSEWWVLDSGTGTARVLDDGWDEVARCPVGGWGRGGALLADGRLAVGISRVRPRYRQLLEEFGDVDNHVALVDPATRRVVERVPVPRVDQVNAVESVPARAIELLASADV